MAQVKEYGKVSITFEGPYDANRTYERLCIVEYADMSFLSKIDNNKFIPTENKDAWLQLSVPGPKGDTGQKGEKGERGEQGAKGIATRTVHVYKTSLTTPDPPVGGSYDFVGNLIIYPEGWGSSDNIEGPVWMSEKTFFEDNSLTDTWSAPMQISGKDGKNGVDGVNIEFIYRVTKNPSIIPDISNLPNINSDDFVPEEYGWSDSPNGVDPTNRIEWVCTRKKKDNNWSSWEGPTIWSAYGEKGQDGDGVEYIFYIENEGRPPKNPTPEDWETNEDYQNIDEEYVPIELGWTDVATGINSENKFEWQCIRKFKDKKWQPYQGPYLWSRYGDKGNVGDKIIEMFQKTSSTSIVPDVEVNNRNPGSLWSMVPPDVFDPSKGEAIWKITTYVDYKNEFVDYEVTDSEGNKTLKKGWSLPVLSSGISGSNGISPNYKKYIYKQSNIKPELPPNNIMETPEGWKDIPFEDVDGDNNVDIIGTWWECTGIVNGESKEITWEYIRCISNTNTKTLFQVTNNLDIPDVIKNNINPGEKWKPTYEVPEAYEYVWMITSEIDGQGNLIGEWQGPNCITGKNGENGKDYFIHKVYSDFSNGKDNSGNDSYITQSQGVIDKEYIGIYTGYESDINNLKAKDFQWSKFRGEIGKTGAAGIPGVSIYLRYCLGTETSPITSTKPSTSTGAGVNWYATPPAINNNYKYIWCTQGEKVYTSETSYHYNWSNIFRLSGINGLDGIGDKGDPGRIIYPAGIYANNVTYVATSKKAPYVWDSNYGKYYVYLSTTPWLGTTQGITPGEEYSANNSSGNNKWELFEQFEAVYTKIGIIGNGLIGSAVFNGDYMFSQQGYTTLTGNLKTSKYEDFNPDNPFGDNNKFYPNICFNFKTGSVWIGRKKFVVDNDTINISNFLKVNSNGVTLGTTDNNLSFDSNGVITNNTLFHKMIHVIDGFGEKSYNVFPGCEITIMINQSTANSVINIIVPNNYMGLFCTINLLVHPDSKVRGCGFKIKTKSGVLLWEYLLADTFGSFYKIIKNRTSDSGDCIYFHVFKND